MAEVGGNLFSVLFQRLHLIRVDPNPPFVELSRMIDSPVATLGAYPRKVIAVSYALKHLTAIIIIFQYIFGWGEGLTLFFFHRPHGDYRV